MGMEHNIDGKPSAFWQELLSRRELIRRGLWGGAGLLLAGNLSIRSLAAASSQSATQPATSPASGKAKSIIQVWLWGGPSHLDTFDPKPDAGSDYCGQFKTPIETNVSGIRICELLPLLAKQADKYSIVRSMTHGNNGHETASYLTQTGRPPRDDSDPKPREVFPTIGAVVNLFKGVGAGYKGMLPPYIVMTQLQGRFSEIGFLNSRYKPFATGGDPAQPRFNVEGVVAQGISDQRQRDRRDLMHKLDSLGHAMASDPQIVAAGRAEKEAYDLILGDAGKVFDLAQEKDDLRERYGRNTFGQSCLMARRLVERGVPVITINNPGWDTHKQNFQTMRQKLPQLDKGLATLFQDLSERGLLDSTIIWCCGEFGRTPKVDYSPPWNGGRGHWAGAFSALVAGGGFKGGHVVGASDAKGEQVKDRAVYPCDLIASIYEKMGIDPDGKLPHPLGLPMRVMPLSSEDAADAVFRPKETAGLLREIM